ncbi:predicted protein [Postia placenta Mad-698-R]|nr:predicted protein [Postia placenta Mad-698-R]
MSMESPRMNVQTGEKSAGLTYGEAKLLFQAIHDEQVLQGADVFGPFESEEEWDLAKWLIKNVGHTQAEKFLKLPIIRNCIDPSFHNKDTFFSAIDALPGGVDWQCQDICLTGDVPNQDSKLPSENLELWFRNPLECIRELISNSTFKDNLHYAPERCFVDPEEGIQVTDEMWTGQWWWDIQHKLPSGAMIAPIILSSDKTRLSQFRGDKSTWPVYLTIGNIVKDVRHKVSSHAMVLIGYLPVAKLNCFSDKTRPVAKYQLFHHCMKAILESVAKAGHTGEAMTCADSLIRSVCTAEINQHTAGTPLEGLHVAHVRVIFALAHHYPLHTDQPLVYVEWFTPFGRIDASSGLHVVSPSSCMHRPYGEVITVDHIVRNCHLLSSFGKAVDSHWTVQTVTEEFLAL